MKKYKVNVNGISVPVTECVYREYMCNTPEARRTRYLKDTAKKNEVSYENLQSKEII